MIERFGEMLRSVVVVVALIDCFGLWFGWVVIAIARYWRWSALEAIIALGGTDYIIAGR